MQNVSLPSMSLVSRKAVTAYRVSSVMTLFSKPIISSLNSLSRCLAAGKSLCSSFIFETLRETAGQCEVYQASRRNSHFAFLSFDFASLLVPRPLQARQVLLHRPDLFEFEPNERGLADCMSPIGAKCQSAEQK